ncbi:Twin-arginine translocation signal domain-containing protein OS=Streptomyces cyaneofuscatus OX=66883 GN=G3I52_09950 PE=4 SV=1 [Streptomyces cyaneofuscatus]
MTDMDRRRVLRLTSAATVAGDWSSGRTGPPTRRAGRPAGSSTGRRTGANIPDVLTAGVPYFVRYDLSDAQGAGVGTENAHCLPVSVGLDGSSVLATLVLSLDDGLITAASSSSLAARGDRVSANAEPWSHVFAITGGTGPASARPLITIHHPARDEDVLTIELADASL